MKHTNHRELSYAASGACVASRIGALTRVVYEIGGAVVETVPRLHVTTGASTCAVSLIAAA